MMRAMKQYLALEVKGTKLLAASLNYEASICSAIRPVHRVPFYVSEVAPRGKNQERKIPSSCHYYYVHV